MDKNSIQFNSSVLPFSSFSNFRVSIDESVFSALLECAYSDPKHQVLGYLGGKCSVDRFDNNMIVCHVSQFVASERFFFFLLTFIYIYTYILFIFIVIYLFRNISSLLTDTAKEVEPAYEEAIKIFKNMGLVLVGWYRRCGFFFHDSINININVFIIINFYVFFPL